MIGTFLTIAAMLFLVFFPVLIPAAVSAVHAVSEWQEGRKAAPAGAYRLRIPGDKYLRIPVPAAA